MTAASGRVVVTFRTGDDATRPWAVVTGASNGIGRACALRLARTGLSLVLVGRDRAALDAVAAEAMATGAGGTHVLPLDLETPGAVATLAQVTAGRRVTVVVAAAGFGSIGSFATRDPHSEAGMVTVNCTAVVQLASTYLPRLLANGEGTLVLFGSIVGFGGVPHSATYAATKSFVQAFAEGLQGEVAGTGVNVLCVAPGPTHSGFAERAGMRMGAALAPDDVAHAIMRSLRRNTTIAPGLLTKVLHHSLRTLGRRGRSFILGRVMRGMDAAAHDGRARA